VLGETDPTNITKQDLLASIAFDKQGTMLSVGDRGGRVIVFQRVEEQGQVDYEYMTEFQAHESTFDPLNSN
jgi:serine/threonine-protein phosphatase 2A regulatory subunit B